MLLDLILVGFNTLVAAGGTLHWHLALDKVTGAADTKARSKNVRMVSGA